MANDYVIGIGMGLDPSGLKKGLADAKREMDLAKSAFEADAGWTKAWDQSIAGIQAKLTQMTTEISAKKDIVELWKQELERVIEIYGEGSKEAMETETKLNNAEASYNKATQYTESLRAKLEELEAQDGETASETDDLAGSIDDAADSADNANNGGFSRFKQGLENLRDKVLSGLKNKMKSFAQETLQTGMDFQSTMSEVQAISGASGETLKSLTETARAYGESTTFSATEAADALKFMALAGWDAEQSSSALGGVLDLAAASGMGLGEASDMVTDYLTAFGLEADQAGKFADEMAYAQAHSNTTAAGLGEAFKNCSANMAASGQTVETTTATLGVLANAGLKGSEAGTALSAIMRDITKKMEDGEIAIGNTSVSVVDADGNFRSLTEILRGVEEAVDGMGTAEQATALQTTFTADSIKGMNLILGQGVDEVASFESALNGADGSAKAMADTMNDNLSGDMKKLESAVDEMKLKLFDLLQGPLRGIVQFVTDNLPLVITLVAGVGGAFAAWKVASVLKEMSGGIKTAITVLQTLTSGTALATAAETAHTIATGAMTAAQGLATAATTALSGAMSFLAANPIVLVVAAIAGIVVALKLLWDNCEEFRDAVKAIWDAICGFFEWAYNSICGLWEPLVAFFEGIWSGIQDAFDGITDFFGGIAEGAVKFFEDPWGSVAGFFGGIWDGIKGAFAGILDFFGINSEDAIKALEKGWDAVAGFFGGIWDGIVGVFTDPVGTFSGIADAMRSGLEGAWNGITGFFGGIWDGIKNAFGGVASWFGDVFGGAVKAIQDVFGGIKKFFEGIWNGIVGIFRPVLGFFGIDVGGGDSGPDPIQEMEERLAEEQEKLRNLGTARDYAYRQYQESGWSQMGYNKYSLASKEYNDQQNKVANLAVEIENAKKSSKSASQGLGGIVTNIKNIFGGVADIITAPFKAAYDAITGIFGGIADWFGQNVIGPIGNALGGVVDAVGDVVGGVADGIVNGAKDVAGGVQKFGEDVFNGFCSFFGIHSPSKLMRDKVGLMIGEGVAEGIRDSVGAVERASDELSEGVSVGGRFGFGGAAGYGQTNYYTYNQTVNGLGRDLAAGEVYRRTKSLIARM